MFCYTFCVHGSCEHVHAAFLHAGLIGTRQARRPQAHGRRPPETATESLDIVMPGDAVASAPISRQHAHRQPQHIPKIDAAVRRLCISLGLQAWDPLLQEAQVNLQTLASFDMLTMKAYFPTLPAGPAAMILQGAVSLSQKAGAAVGEIPEQDSCHAVHNMCVELRECVKSRWCICLNASSVVCVMSSTAGRPVTWKNTDRTRTWHAHTRLSKRQGYDNLDKFAWSAPSRSI